MPEDVALREKEELERFIENLSSKLKQYSTEFGDRFKVDTEKVSLPEDAVTAYTSRYLYDAVIVVQGENRYERMYDELNGMFGDLKKHYKLEIIPLKAKRDRFTVAIQVAER